MNDKTKSMAKTMKYVPIALGVACLILGVAALFLKMELETKVSVFIFALFGVIGLFGMVLGAGLSALFEAREERKTSSLDDDDVDILA